MATKLIKSVKREMLATDRGRTLIVELEPGDILTFRAKGKKQRYSVSLHKAFNLALMQFLTENYNAKMADYKAKQKAGYKRLRSPKKPTVSMFSKEYRIALK